VAEHVKYPFVGLLLRIHTLLPRDARIPTLEPFNGRRTWRAVNLSSGWQNAL
jgi:hypothetical protein